jgi:hypothetical protein
MTGQLPIIFVKQHKFTNKTPHLTEGFRTENIEEGMQRKHKASAILRDNVERPEHDNDRIDVREIDIRTKALESRPQELRVRGERELKRVANDNRFEIREEPRAIVEADCREKSQERRILDPRAILSC